MIYNSKSEFGDFTLWLNDGKDTPPQDTENYWLFYWDGGVGMFSRQNHQKELEARSIIGTMLVLYKDSVTFLTLEKSEIH